MTGRRKSYVMYVKDKGRLKEISRRLGMPMAKVVELGAEVLEAVLTDDYLFYVVGTRIGHTNIPLAEQLMKYRLKYLEGQHGKARYSTNS